MKKAVMRQIDSSTWLFEERALGTPVYMYLLLGSERALLIDTGYGFTDVPAAIRQITSLPVSVINTHAHFDHMHGNHLYDSAMVSALDEECFRRHNDSGAITELFHQVLSTAGIPRFLFPLLNGVLKPIAQCHPSRHEPLPESGILDLGGRKIRILETPGHTAGSICLLDENTKRLFSGDTCCEEGVLLNFPESTGVTRYREGLLALRQLAEQGEITEIYPSHQTTPMPVSILSSYIAACDRLLSGDVTEAERKKGIYVHEGITINMGSKPIQEETK